MELSIVIRTYNSEQDITRLLERLQQLEVPQKTVAEFIFVDNNSQDGTTNVIASYLEKLPIPGRVVVETKPGAAATRLRGLSEASGQYVAFLDDDNLPHSNWLVEIDKAIAAHPNASALSGKIQLLNDAPIPSFVKPYLVFFAIVDRGKKAFRYDLTPKKVLPPGAGLILQRPHTTAVLQNVGLKLAGPIGNGFSLKGEDIELLIKLQSDGGEIWYCPEIIIDHAVSVSRFTPEYMYDFLTAIARPRHYHRLLRLRQYLWVPLTFAYFLADFKRWLLHCFRYEDKLEWRLRNTLNFQILISPLNTLRILMSPTFRLESGNIDVEDENQIGLSPSYLSK